MSQENLTLRDKRLVNLTMVLMHLGVSPDVAVAVAAQYLAANSMSSVSPFQQVRGDN